MRPFPASPRVSLCLTRPVLLGAILLGPKVRWRRQVTILLVFRPCLARPVHRCPDRRNLVLVTWALYLQLQTNPLKLAPRGPLMQLTTLVTVAETLWFPLTRRGTSCAAVTLLFFQLENYHATACASPLPPAHFHVSFVAWYADPGRSG